MRYFWWLLPLAISAFGAEPFVKTVPWVASDPSIPHDTLAFKSTTLKGTSSLQGPNIRAVWDFGDGSAPAALVVEDGYDVSVAHVYGGKPGDVFTARLTVTDMATGESGSAVYLVAVRERTLQSETNMAIDEGLWYLHRSMSRTNVGDLPAGDWNGSCFACDLSGVARAWNVLAFERHGHLESGNSTDPYTETVARGMRTLLGGLSNLDAITDPVVLAAIAAANSPNTTALTGVVSGKPYREILARLAASNGAFDREERADSPAAETGNLLAALADPAATPEAALRLILDRQDRTGFWYGHNAGADSPLETAQSLLSISNIGLRNAGANSVLNVSAQVNVTNTGFLFGRATGTYNGTLSVKNTSAAPVPGPVTVGILGLAPGITLANASGAFNGAPYITVTGSSIDPGLTSTVQLRFTNPANAVISFNRVTYSDAFPPTALSVTCPASTGTTGVAYNSALDANGGVRNYTYSTIGSLPSGLTLNASTGAVTGTPDTPGNISFTAVVTDSAGPSAQTANASCSINVANGSNAAPSANPQTTGTNEDTPVIITLTGSDPESASLTFSIVSGPTNGSLGAIVPINTTSTSVQYTPGLNFNGSASFTFKVNDGTQDSAAATVTINVTAVNDAPSFTKGPDQNISQNAPAQTLVGWATAIGAGPADESGQTLTFNVIGNTNPALFTVAPAISPTGTLTYTPAAGQSGSATITVTLSDNGGTANGGSNTSGPQTFGINIALVNQAPSFTKGPDQTVLEDAGAQTFAAWATAISPGPASESGQTVNFNITGNTNPALFSAGPAVSSTGTLTFTPAANANGAATITIVAQDNGGTANGGVDTSAPQAFVINVTAVNDAPSFTKGPDQTVPEDSGAQTVPSWATAISTGPADESGQTLTFNITGNTNAALFSGAPAISPAGTLTYTPAPNVGGTATITVTLSDSGGGTNTSSAQQFVITVTSVNDAPSFTKGANQTVNEDSALQTIVGWATAISAGNGEASQTVSFVIDSIDNPGLFTGTNGQLPAVASNGTLSFRPALNKNGVANVTLHIQDNGGTANGGVDSSATQNFTITVNAVNDAPVAPAAKIFNVQPNMKIVVGSATGLAAGWTDVNDPDNITPAFTLTALTPASGAATFAADGSFTYDPVAGATSDVAFTYTVCDNGVGTPASACTNSLGSFHFVSTTVVWFVDPNLALPGAGTLSSPFNSLAAANTAKGTAANHHLFVYNSANANGPALTASGVGVTLSANQSLAGQAVTGTTFDALFGISPPVTTLPRPSLAGLRPQIQGTVALGNNSFVRGLTIAPPTNTAGLTGSGVSGVSTSEVSVTTTGTGIAVNLVNTPAGVFSFTSISSTGAANGIIWNNSTAATGSFTVAGSGGTCTNANTSGCSGGTIANTTGGDNSTATPGGTGIVLNNANNVSLTRMFLHDHSNYGVRGTNVTGFILNNSVINGVNGTNAGSPFNDSSVRFNNLTGSASVTSTHVQGGFADNFSVSNNTAGNLDRLTFTSATIGTNSNPGGNDGISIESLPASTGALKMTITTSVFTAAAGDLVQYSHNGTGAGDLVITNSQFSNNHPTIATGGGGVSLFADGNATMTITGNTFRDSVGHGVLIAKTQPDATTLGVTFNSNSIGVSGVANSGSKEGSALKLQTLGGGSFNAQVRNNSIFGFNNNGIELLAGGGASATGGNLHATITGNTVAEPGNTVGTQAISKNGIHWNIGTTPGDTFAACAKLGGDGTAGNEKNSISTSGKDGIPATGLGDIDFRLRQRQSTTIRLPGYGGANTDNTAVVAFVTGNNNAGGTPAGLASNTVPTGGGFVGGAACTLP